MYVCMYVYILKLYSIVSRHHCFKNQTGPAGSAC